VQVHRPRDRLDLERRRVDRPAAEQCLGPAGLGDDRRQPVIQLGLRAHDVEVVAQLVDVVQHERQRGRGEHGGERRSPPAAEPAGDVAHQLDPARAREHADQCRRERDVAQVAGESRLRHGGDRDHQRRRHAAEGQAHAVTRAPGARQGDRGAEQHRQRQHRARAGERLGEREVRECRGVGVRLARP
jgi:hypothetical protein